MTIFVNNNADKKEDSNSAPPEVVREVKLLLNDGKKEAGPPPPAPLIAVRRTAPPTSFSHRYVLLKLCAVLLVLVLLVILIFVGFTIYHKAKHPELFRGRCGVRFYDPQPGIVPGPPGEFEQQVTIEDLFHERIEVPNVGDTRRATVLHDFNRNVTAIVDKDQDVCFIMPLNRTLVKPPRNFWDMMLKLKSGYYIPDVNVVRERYRAVTPPLQDLTSLGFNIWMECSSYDTYRLVREGEPIAMSKRSAQWCEFSGKQWCLGDGGGTEVPFITVTDCL